VSRTVEPRRRAAGFTLLEVMVALAILAGSMLAVSEIVSGALRNHVRARNLEVATLLARGKLAALEDHYETKGFKTSDEADDGTFEEEGHPEVRWRVEVTVPPGELGPEAVLTALTGSPDALQQLFPKGDGGDQGSALAAGFQQVIQAQLQQLLAGFGQKLKQGARQLRLTVSWPEGAGEESFAVTTHMVVLAPREQLPQATGGPATPPAPPASAPPTDGGQQ
jgi:general secretion pathway protein I